MWSSQALVLSAYSWFTNTNFIESHYSNIRSLKPFRLYTRQYKNISKKNSRHIKKISKQIFTKTRSKQICRHTLVSKDFIHHYSNLFNETKQVYKQLISKNKQLKPLANCERKCKQSHIPHLVKMLVLPVAKAKNCKWKVLEPFPSLISLYEHNHKTMNTNYEILLSNTKPINTSQKLTSVNHLQNLAALSVGSPSPYLNTPPYIKNNLKKKTKINYKQTIIKITHVAKKKITRSSFFNFSSYSSSSPA